MPSLDPTFTDANAFLFEKKGIVVAEWAGLSMASLQGEWGALRLEALTVCANMESLGARLDSELARILSCQTPEALGRFYAFADQTLRSALGAKPGFEPMYPNFPRQVIESSEAELYANAMAHYAGAAQGIQALPSYARLQRDALSGGEPKTLSFKLAGQEEAWAYAADLARSKISFSDSDKEGLKKLWLAAHSAGELDSVMSRSVGSGNKENAARCAALASEFGQLSLFTDSMSVCTDALRVACAMSNGDPSLAAPTRFGKFTRPQRRALLSVLERHLSGSDPEQALEDVFRRREAWLRLGERLHPGELAKACPLAANAFAALRKNAAPQPFAGRVQHAFETRDLSQALALLGSRPGELARRAAAAARVFGASAHAQIIDLMRERAPKIATNVLVQAMASFEAAQTPLAHRAFMPKGGMGKIFLQEGAPALDPQFASQMASVCEEALLQRFSQLSPLGKCHIDPALGQVKIPFAQRSASRSLRSLGRGSRSAVEGEIARLFIYWSEKGVGKDGLALSSSRIDIDLSCMTFDADFQPCGHVSFTALRGQGVTHSGDVTSAPNGACEFIDIDYAKLPENVKYIAMTVHSFTGQSFDQAPECFAGWMERPDAMSGEIFEPSLVRGKNDLAASATTMMPVVLDVQARQAIIADLSLGGAPGYSLVERHSKTLSHAVKALALSPAPTLGALFSLHARARGSITLNASEADTIFSMNEGVTPYDFERIGAEFLSDPAPAAAPAMSPKRR